MRTHRIRLFVAGLLGLFLIAGSAHAQAPERGRTNQAPPAPRTYSEADLWNRSGDRITFTLAQVSFPVDPGATRLAEIREASRPGQGLDNALIYYSSDQQVFATVYAYAPALADAGFTAFMTDHAIHLQSGSDLRNLRSAVVAAGGREGVAIRADYAGFRQNRLASSAAYMRVGRWIIKLRVSGPEARRAEVESTMAALLRDMRFEGRMQPATAMPITADACEGAAGRAARLTPSDDADTMADAIMSHSPVDDAAGSRQGGASGPPAATPHWCRSAGYRIPNAMGPTPVLRDMSPGVGDDTWRRVLVALIGDNGTMLEVAERRFRNRTRYILIYHQIGQTMVLGAYDRVPTDEQIGNIATGADREGGRARATIDYQARGDSSINVQVAPGSPRT